MRVKTMLRDTAAQLLSVIGVTASKWCGRGRLSVATFHRVLPEAERQTYPYPGLVVTPEELGWFLTHFEKHFDCGTLAAQDERFRSGGISHRPLLALTFDDGQYDNYRNARPVLAKHRIKATFFVPVVAVERQELLWHDRLGFAVLALLRQPQGGERRLTRILSDAGLSASGPRSPVENAVQESKKLAMEARMRLVESLAEASGIAHAHEFARLMTFEELAALAADGHEIGSHSMTHCMMPECDDRALKYELSESRSTLRARLGLPIESFCYPNGNADDRTAKAVAKAGYRRAVTTTSGHNDQKTDRFRLRRYDMVARHLLDSDEKLSAALLAFRMSGFYPGLG